MRSLPTTAVVTAALAIAATLPAQSVTTTFSDNAGSSSFWPSPSVAFDMNVSNPAGIVVTSFEVNMPYVGIPGQFEFYTTAPGGTSVGFQINPPPGTWLLRAKGTMTSAGSGTAAPVTLDKPVYLSPGTYGVYLVHRGVGLRYTNGTQLTYGNADVTLTMGTAQATAFTSTLNTPRIANLTMHYTQVADTVDFTADTLSGPAPLTVNFADRSVMPTAGVLGYEWDFDNDNTVDSTLQNPTHVYAACGDYSPRLRILTTTGFVDRVWPGLIAVDPVIASFTASPQSGTPPLTVGFVDTSVGATSWAWDFDDDGQVDSTLQNPTWTYGAGSYTARLTAGNGCRSVATTQRIDSVTDTWTTNYTASTNLISKQSVAFFDLAITSTEALVLSAIDVNTIVHITQPCPIRIWTTDGSAAGVTATPGAWRVAAEGNGISAGGNAPTRITLDRPILLLPGRTYGFGIQYIDAQVYYNAPGTATMSHPDFTVTFRGIVGSATPFTVAAASARQWNGTLHYTRVGTWSIGSISTFALGCAGTLGVPSMVPQPGSRPKLGTQLQIDIGNLPVGGAFLIFGFSNTASAFGPLPLNLGFFGAPNCNAHVSADANVFLFSPTGTVTFSSTLPNDPALASIAYYMQSLAIDPAANAFGGTMSDALAIVTGIY